MLASLFAVLPLLALVSASPVVKRADSRLIQSGRSNGYCLSVQGGRQAVADGNFNNGTPVTTLLCSVASFWDISPGSGSVVVSGTNYALDIGLQPGNNGPVKVSLDTFSLRRINADSLGLAIIPRCPSTDLVPHRRQPYCHYWR